MTNSLAICIRTMKCDTVNGLGDTFSQINTSCLTKAPSTMSIWFQTPLSNTRPLSNRSDASHKQRNRANSFNLFSFKLDQKAEFAHCILINLRFKVRTLPGRGYSTNVSTGRLRSEVQSLTLLCTRYPFHIPSIDKWYPFHIPCLELCFPFNCCKCTVF